MFLLLGSSSNFGQTRKKEPEVAPQLVEILAENVREGDLIAFRDLCKLYDKYPNDAQIKSLLFQHTNFLTSEWDSTNPTTSATDFFYQHAESFRFSELLQVFYLTPIEARPNQAVLQPKKSREIAPFIIRESVQRMKEFMKKGATDGVLEELDKIGSINNAAIHQLLSGLITKKEMAQFSKKEQQRIFTKVFNYLPDSLAIEKLLQLTKTKQLDKSYCKYQLTRLTNNQLLGKSHQEIWEAYTELLATYQQNLTAVKKYGYEKVQRTNPLFFENEVDYYGWILATIPDSLHWIRRNAVLNLLETKQPKALFYLAGLHYRAMKAGQAPNAPFIDLLNQQIDVQVSFSDLAVEKGNTSFLEKAEEQFIRYWANQYTDYVWDAFERKFVNQQLFSNELEAYDRYFRRLNSTNDTIAQKAFIALAQGKPNEIKKLIKKFKPLLRNYNTSLPPLKYRILEQISLLSHFCQQNEIAYLPKGDLLASLEKLQRKILPEERVELENQLIAQLKLADLTSLEYYAAVRAQNLDLNYSIGRILDYLYTKHWSTILSNERNFRLFLLKLDLFKGLGGFGVCKKYSAKVDLENQLVISALNGLSQLETNANIRRSVAYFLEKKVFESAEKRIAKFLESPKATSPEAVKALPPFNEVQVEQVLQGLFLQEDRKATKNIGNYLELYASIDMVPALFEMPQAQWEANKYAGAALVKVLEHVYQFSFETKSKEAIQKWWQLWKTMPDKYESWSEFLFEQQVEQLRSAQILTISDVNKVSNSAYYTEEYRTLCLKSLERIKRKRTIYRLQIEPAVSVANELFYFDHIDFSAKELGNLSKVFNIDDPNKLLEFIQRKAAQSSVSDKSSLYNTLFRQAWFINHVTNGKIEPSRCDAIKMVYYQYLSQSTFLTEYEEQTTQLNIVHLENAFLSLKEKLKRIAKDSLNETIRYDYLNATLSRMEFPEIIIAFPILKDLAIANKNLFLFLNRDFGLPIFDVADEKEAQSILRELQTLNEFEFYEKYLVDFGLPILNKDQSLDFEKIYQLLTYDLVVPFLGEGGKYRDYYVYGLVKLLELHFKTTLGFHPKLNENQTFYTFNSFKRVAAWRTYLVENGLVESRNNKSFR
ncbi:MAG: hypothetical protein AAF960_08075 [Bacteroidota bacterium]